MNLLSMVGVPDCSRLGNPRGAIQQHIQHDIGINQHLHEACFLSSSSASIRAHSSSEGAALSVAQIPKTRSEDSPLSPVARDSCSIDSRTRRASAIRDSAGQAFTCCRTDSTSEFEATMMVSLLNTACEILIESISLSWTPCLKFQDFSETEQHRHFQLLVHVCPPKTPVRRSKGRTLRRRSPALRSWSVCRWRRRGPLRRSRCRLLRCSCR